MPDAESMTAGQKPRSSAWQPAITVVQEAEPPFIPAAGWCSSSRVSRRVSSGLARRPGGDVIHCQDGSNRAGIPVRLPVTMLCEPGKPMLTFAGSSGARTAGHPAQANHDLSSPHPSYSRLGHLIDRKSVV